MSSTLVIRFGALGDLCICSWFLAGLARREDARPLTLVTKPAFRDLAAEIPGVDQVLCLEGSGLAGLWTLARAVRRDGPATILDAHAVLRSRALTVLAGRRPDARLAKDTAARLRLLNTPGSSTAPGLDRHLLDRFDALVDGTPGRSMLASEVSPPLAHLRPADAPAVPAVAIAPGARWTTKQWPANKFREAAQAILEAGLALRIILGPDEHSWFDGSPLASLADQPGVSVTRDADLPSVARILASCRATLCNDSGLLHLSEAVGTPVVALFGPTVPAFGYAPLLPTSRLCSVDLDCRPCSRTGSRPCHRGDLACLEGIPVDDAVADVLAVLEATP